MAARLEGKVAIVTGSGRGIGRAEALAFARQGAKLVINDIGGHRGRDAADDVAQSVVDEIRAMGGEAVTNSDDVGSWDGARRVVETAMDAFGRLDILMNNAGNARVSRIDEMSEADWDMVVRVHLKGHAAMIRHAAPVFREQKSGVIINTGSTSGLGHYGMSNYSAAKEGILGLTYSAARDLGQFGVRCNAIRPIATTQLGDPDLAEAKRPPMDETIVFQQETLGIPASGFNWVGPEMAGAHPDYVGDFVAWLASDAASNVTGKVFYVSYGTIGLYPDQLVSKSVYVSREGTLDELDEPGRRKFLIGDIVNRFDGSARQGG